MKKKSEKKARQPDLPSLPKLDQEPLSSSEEDIPMFFTRQEQLLDIFQVFAKQTSVFLSVTVSVHQYYDFRARFNI